MFANHQRGRKRLTPRYGRKMKRSGVRGVKHMVQELDALKSTFCVNAGHSLKEPAHEAPVFDRRLPDTQTVPHRACTSTYRGKSFSGYSGCKDGGATTPARQRGVACMHASLRSMCISGFCMSAALLLFLLGSLSISLATSPPSLSPFNHLSLYLSLPFFTPPGRDGD